MPSIFHLPPLKESYQRVVVLGSGKSLSVIGAYLLWLALTMVLAQQYGAEFAGWFFGLGAVFQIAFVIPLGGYLADRLGSIKVIKLQVFAFILCGLIWLIGKSGMTTYVLVGFLMFFAYGLLVGRTYLMKTTSEGDGGTVFGIFATLLAVGTLVSTLIYPYFKEIIYPAVPIILLISQFIYLGILYYLPEDGILRNEPIRIQQAYRVFFQEIKESFHFIKANSYVPLLAVGDALFEGVFYAAVWFLLPLQVVQHVDAGILDGLSLGIYELVTILSAGGVGYLADKYGNRRKVGLAGWIIIIFGVIGMYLWHTPVGLIIFGAMIAFGNNLEYGSAYHALEKYDIDHEEDGAFNSLIEVTKTIGYLVVPIVMGIVYSTHGLTGSLGILATVVTLIAVIVFLVSQKLVARKLEVL